MFIIQVKDEGDDDLYVVGAVTGHEDKTESDIADAWDHWREENPVPSSYNEFIEYLTTQGFVEVEIPEHVTLHS